MSDAETLARLRWRCRRGMLELDVVLERFIDSQLEQLEAADLTRFETLLEAQDHDLMEWLLKGDPVPDSDLQPLVDRIRSLPVA